MVCCPGRYTCISLSAVHVLPFVANFRGMVERLEDALSDAAEPGTDGSQRGYAAHGPHARQWLGAVVGRRAAQTSACVCPSHINAGRTADVC